MQDEGEKVKFSNLFINILLTFYIGFEYILNKLNKLNDKNTQQ